VGRAAEGAGEAGDMPGDAVPADEAPAGEVPAGEAPGGMPAEAAAAEEADAPAVPVEEAPPSGEAISAAVRTGCAGAVASLPAGLLAPPVLPPLPRFSDPVRPFAPGPPAGVLGLSLMRSGSSFWSGVGGQRGRGAEQPQ